MIAKLALSFCALALVGAQANAGWERIAPLPEGNGGFVCGVVAGEIVILGGTNWRDGAKHWLRRIHTYDSAKDQWREVGSLAGPLAYAVAGNDAATLWFAGGSSGAEMNRTVWKMGADFTVKEVRKLDSGAAIGGGALSGPVLYTLGGTDDMNQLSRATRELRAIDLRSGATTRLADYPEPAFMIGAFAACGDRLFAFGGARWDAESNAVANLSAAHAWSPAAQRWEKLPPLPHAIRGITAVTLDDRHILLAGGYTTDAEGFTDGALIFDVKVLRYSPTKPLPIKAMVGLVRNGEWLYCLGGEDRKQHRTDAAFRIRWKELLPR